MSARKEILFLAHRIPYPPDKGDKIRSWRLLKYLTEHYRVHLASFVDDPVDFTHAPFLESLCESATLIPVDRAAAMARCARGLIAGDPLTVAYFRDNRMKRAVDALRRRPLIAEVAFSSTMAQYIEQDVAGRPRLVDFCDADSDKFVSYAEDARFPMTHIFTREGRLLERAENEIANWADASFAITPEEAARFNKRAEIMRKVGWWSNGVDTDYFDPEADFAPLANPASIVFTGAMDYRANIDAASWFVSAVWPHLRAMKPDATFAIVGARPSRAVKALAQAPGVMVTGRVDDIRPWIAGAQLAVAPLRIARGVQNKALEAMAMGKPVLATTAAATGLQVSPATDILIADAATDFAKKIVDLLDDREKRDRIGAAARARVLTDYQWDRQVARFGEALQASLPSSSAPAASAA